MYIYIYNMYVCIYIYTNKGRVGPARVMGLATSRSFGGLARRLLFVALLLVFVRYDVPYIVIGIGIGIWLWCICDILNMLAYHDILYYTILNYTILCYYNTHNVRDYRPLVSAEPDLRCYYYYYYYCYYCYYYY